MNKPIKPACLGTIPYGSKRERTTKNRKVKEILISLILLSLKMGEEKSTVVLKEKFSGHPAFPLLSFRRHYCMVNLKT